MLQTDAIAALLHERARPDLAALYHPGMEVQVTVAADGGHRVDGTYRGRRSHGWTDGTSTWRPFRVPWHAWSDPRYVPTPMDYDLAEHFEGIGLTGWDWQARVSRWVGFDFDSIVNHAAGLTPEELDQLREEIAAIPWATLRRSTSGLGLHVYVVPGTPIETVNHREHAALARGILALAETHCSFPLQTKVDTCGQVLWIAHRDADARGYELLRQGAPLEGEPPGWRLHLRAVGKRRAMISAPVLKEPEAGAFEEVAAGTRHVPLDATHRLLLGWFAKRDVTWWWDPDRHMLVCHTSQLAEAHRQLGLRGIFRTVSSGSTEQNCFAFPVGDGAWIVRRHGRGVQEAPTWTRDASGWTRCVYNRLPTFEEACLASLGTETAAGGYTFERADLVEEALKLLGVTDYPSPDGYLDRPATIEPVKRRHRYVVRIPRQPEDPGGPEGWLRSNTGRFWERVVRLVEEVTPALLDPETEEVVRHVVAQDQDAGWYVRCRSGWSREPKDNLRSALHALSYQRAESELLLGKAILRPWVLVNEPFASEYPGNRRWNHRAAQLAVTPAAGGCPTWDLMLDHVGHLLTEGVLASSWCQRHAVTTGGDYLRCWVASLLQDPTEPLPYLAFFGPELGGKSTFHEALGLLFADGRGYIKADVALRSQGAFNGELASAVLCVVEEVNVARAKGAYDRLKDWVTSPTLLVHPKGGTPYPVRNTTHWVHATNDPSHVPVLPGDTRIVLIRVTPPETLIPRRVLRSQLEAEAGAFLRTSLELELPPAEERLRIPAIATLEKLARADLMASDIELFLEEETCEAVGYAIETQELHQAFLAWLEPDDRSGWTRHRFIRELPPHLVKGRYGTSGRFHVGNLVLKETAREGLPEKPRLVRSPSGGRRLIISEPPP